MKTITYYINFKNQYYIVDNFSQTSKLINHIYVLNEVISFTIHIINIVNIKKNLTQFAIFDKLNK